MAKKKYQWNSWYYLQDTTYCKLAINVSNCMLKPYVLRLVEHLILSPCLTDAGWYKYTSRDSKYSIEYTNTEKEGFTKKEINDKSIGIYTHSVKIMQFSCHSVFTWVWSLKICYFDRFNFSEIWLKWIFAFFQRILTENQNSEPLKLTKCQFLRLYT